MLLLFLTETYSLNLNSNLQPSRGTFMVPGRGFMSTMYGGMVSLSPPEGDSVVFAQECENIIGRAIISMPSISGIYFFISKCQFLLCLLCLLCS